VDRVLRTSVPCLKQKWIAIMKLSSLLLSSAAVIVAGSAYAADLPAKKGAPAAKPAATGCPAFGVGYFQIPGADTCLQFTGNVQYTGTYDQTSSPTFANGTYFRFIMNTASNTEAGAVKSNVRVNNWSLSRANIQFNGLTVGKAGSLSDVAGSSPWYFGSGVGVGTNDVVQYAMPVGAATVSIGMETAVGPGYYATSTATSTTAANTGTSNRPDLLLKVSVPAAGVTFNTTAISHNAQETTAGGNDGYALLAGASVSSGAFGALLWGGASNGALGYTGTQGLGQYNAGYNAATSSFRDIDTANNKGQGNVIGGEISIKAGSGTFYLDATNQSITQGVNKLSAYQLAATYHAEIAKGLWIEPAVNYVAYNGNGATASNSAAGTAVTGTDTVFQMRIGRDF